MSSSAVISGQAGVALLIEGDHLASIHAGRSEEPVRCSPGEARFLLGDAKDLQFVEDAELAEIARQLEKETARVDALHLALILLDKTLDEGTRREAAQELDDLLADDNAAEFVENILFSKPLPEEADVACACVEPLEGASKTKTLIERLSSSQQGIREVYGAWLEIPLELFGSEDEREQFLRDSARMGISRGLVLAEGLPARYDLLGKVPLQVKWRSPRYREILDTWIAVIEARVGRGGGVLGSSEEPPLAAEGEGFAEATEGMLIRYLGLALEELSDRDFALVFSHFKLEQLGFRSRAGTIDLDLSLEIQQGALVRARRRLISIMTRLLRESGPRIAGNVRERSDQLATFLEERIKIQR